MGMLRKNDDINLTIEDHTREGHGLGRTDGYVVVVPGGVRGDKLLVHIVKAGKNMGYGKILDILSPSPCRIPSDCAVSGRCGGCAFRTVSYEEEKRLKEKRVTDALRRIADIPDPPVLPIVGSDDLYGYRNKAQYPVRSIGGKAATGFFAPASHRLIPAENCRIEPEIFGKILRFTLDFAERHRIPPYEEETHGGRLRHLYLRQGKATGETLVCPVVNGAPFPAVYADELQAAFPEVKCVCCNINTARTNAVLGKETVFLTDRKYITDTLLGKTFHISPHSFYQVNRNQTEKLYALVCDTARVTENDTVLDLYCGIGTIGICAAANAKKLVGVEIVPDAVENARENAVRNGLTNAEYYCADAKAGAKMLIDKGYCFTVVIVDPPRKGCDEDTVAALGRLLPEKIVYVSCDPATLARDVKRLAAFGYELRSAVPVDMFPRTAHIETVTLITRVGS